MARSALLDLGKPTYPFAPYLVTGLEFNPQTEEDVEKRSPPIPGTWRIYVADTSSNTPGEEPGLDRSRVRLECRIVETPAGKPLNLPEGVGEGWQFPLTIRGRSGIGTIDSSPNSQLADVQSELGETFTVVWRTVK